MAVRYNLPGGGQGYGGADFWIKPGRDGNIYVVYCGIRPKTPANPEFGPQAFRILFSGQTEWLNLEQPPRADIRASVVEYPDRAEVAWYGEGERFIVAEPLPGYVPVAFDGTLPAPIPTQPLPGDPAPVGDHECVDEEGRKYTNDVKNRLMGEVTRLDKRIDGLGSGSSGGLSADALWASNLIPDRVYVDIQRPESGIRGQMEAIARAVAPSAPQLNRDELKALVREVLLELINE